MVFSAFVLFYGGPAEAVIKTRIKDIAKFEGVRENQLVGYGLVIGLNGTGDSLRKSIFTKESVVSMLERMGVNIRELGDVDTKNIAAVMVTATLPAFARQGSHIDVVVSAMGDAKNLLGGTLLVTPLVGADGEVYAVAQGPVATSGFAAQGKATTVTKGVPTSGRIANGAIVEREVGYELAQLNSINISLRNPDFTTAQRVEEVINKKLGQKAARARDPATIHLTIPASYEQDRVALLTTIEQLSVIPDQAAKVVVDDHDGVIVMGEHTKISTVAVSHGSITVRITEEDQVSQPNSFTTGTGALAKTETATNLTAQDSDSQEVFGSINLSEDSSLRGASATTAAGSSVSQLKHNQTQNTTERTSTTQIVQGPGGAQTTVVARSKVDVDESDNAKMAIVDSGASLQDLVNSLNALGASPRDMITILQSIKASGALQASIEVI